MQINLTAQIPSTWEYLVDEVMASINTKAAQDRCNELGASGWQLLFVGPYGDIPDAVRAYYIRPGQTSQELPVPENQDKDK